MNAYVKQTMLTNCHRLEDNAAIILSRDKSWESPEFNQHLYKIFDVEVRM